MLLTETAVPEAPAFCNLKAPRSQSIPIHTFFSVSLQPDRLRLLRQNVEDNYVAAKGNPASLEVMELLWGTEAPAALLDLRPDWSKFPPTSLRIPFFCPLG